MEPATPGSATRFVALGASEGGAEAFERFFSRMPPDPGIAFIVLQQIDLSPADRLISVLARHTAMDVVEATAGIELEPNRIYIVPPNAPLAIEDRIFRVARGENRRHGHIDAFLRSLAEDQGENAIAAILSGAGDDGRFGVKAIKERGGMVMVQSPETTRFDAMPRAAIATGLADYTLPVDEMPLLILDFFRRVQAMETAEPTERRPAPTDPLESIIAVLKRKTGHDFGEFRRTTLLRRVRRRVVLLRLESVRGIRRSPAARPRRGAATVPRSPDRRHALLPRSRLLRDPRA